MVRPSTEYHTKIRIKRNDQWYKVHVMHSCLTNHEGPLVLDALHVQKSHEQQCLMRFLDEVYKAQLFWNPAETDQPDIYQGDEAHRLGLVAVFKEFNL